MKRCPDCQEKIGFSQIYCPHCSGELFRGKRRHEMPQWLTNLGAVLHVREDKF